jgi:hypothetical protein
MSQKSETFPFECDAPPYSIVKACHMIGIRAPEDVRWCRLSHFRRRLHSARVLLDPQTWKALLGMDEHESEKCNCGQVLPVLELYTFTLLSGRQRQYLLAQCGRCRTIFWEEP